MTSIGEIMNTHYDESMNRLTKRMAKYTDAATYKKQSDQWNQIQLLRKQNITDDESICKNKQRNVPQR
jgi:hypothetical protein